MATFSVIVPVYNAAHTIERCVDSIAASGGDDVQIILIEDCSKDRSWEVCCQLARKYPTVMALHNAQNRGVSYTRNRGLEAAQGEYLLFVDSDDWVDEDYVPAFRRAIAAGATFAICGFINHDEKQNGRTDRYGWDDFSETKTEALRDVIEPLYKGTLLQQLWNKVFLRRIVMEQGIRFDESISLGEDTRFVLDYIQRGGIESAMLINAPLYHYMRDQSGGLMFRVGYESVEEPLKNLHKLYQIMDLPAKEIEKRLETDRQNQLELYAYLIMHNMGMPLKEKKRLILALDPKTGKPLFWRNLTLYWKERAATLLGTCKKGVPLWIKCPLTVLLSEFGRWPLDVVFAHMRRSFAQNGGCGEAGKRRAEQAIQKTTYAWVRKHYRSLLEERAKAYTLGQPVENGTVWVFWWQGEDKAPAIVQRCIASIRKNAGAHPVQVIDQWNYAQFVSIPAHIEEKRERGVISLTHFSDYLRMALLAAHGGLWLDATIYVAGDLQQAFRDPIFTVRNPGRDEGNISGWNWSVFGISGNRQYILFCLVRDLLDAYWHGSDHLIDYYIFDYMIRLVYDSCEQVRVAINDIPENNPGLYFYQENFNLEAQGKNPPADTWLYKLSWKGQYAPRTEEGAETVYGRWLRQMEDTVCPK